MAAPSHLSRFAELVSLLTEEFDRVSNENQGYKGARAEFTRRVEEHASELTAMLAAFHDIERKHQLAKERYEAEILRLKGQPVPLPSQTPTSSVPALPQPPLSNHKSHPEPSAQLASYNPSIPPSDHALPTMFSRSMTHPQSQPQPPQQPHPPQQPSAPQQPRLMSIPSLPSAPAPPPAPSMGTGPAPHTLGRRPPITTGKMSAMPLMQPPNGVSSRENPGLPHVIKKDATPIPLGQPMPPPPALGSAAPGNAGFGPPAPRSTVLPPGATQQPPTRPRPPTQTSGDTDWFVYQGRNPNGTVVDMKVNLQHSLTLDSVVCCVRYSWDGQYLAAGSNRAAHIFDAATGQNVATFSKDTETPGEGGKCPDSYVRAVCFSPDGNWLITGAEDHMVKVWDVRNRKVKHRLVGHGTDIYSVDASANSQFIISGSGDKRAKLWSLESGKLLSTLGGDFGPTDGITSVSVSPTSQHVAAGSLDKVVRVWDVETTRLVRQFQGHGDSVYSVAFSPDGRLLLSGSLDRSLKLWDLSAGQSSTQCQASFTGHKDFVLSVSFSPNGQWLMSGSKDRTVQFWDPRQSTMCVMLQGHKNSVISIAHNPANKCVATGSGDCRARTWMYTP